MSDNVSGCFAVAFRFCSRPGPLQFLLGLLGRLPEGENEPGPEDQTAQRRSQPVPDTSRGDSTEQQLVPWLSKSEGLRKKNLTSTLHLSERTQRLSSIY